MLNYVDQKLFRHIEKVVHLKKRKGKKKFVFKFSFQ